VGRLRLRLMDREGALQALQRAAQLGPSLEGVLDLALAYALAGDLGAELSACEQAIAMADDSAVAWSRYAHALARSDRVSECARACMRALDLGYDREVQELYERVREMEPRVLPAA
jgi:tetratricopeptide (TPR) repeat protein